LSEKQTNELPFESSLSRLEQILEKMNSGTVALEEALRLYEEADGMIASCNDRLNKAEKRVEVLIKNRAGDVEMGSDGKPLTQSFSPNGTQK